MIGRMCTGLRIGSGQQPGSLGQKPEEQQQLLCGPLDHSVIVVGSDSW